MSANPQWNSPIDYEVLCERCENLIRQGNLTTTRDLLANLPHHRTPRKFRVYIAQIYRRVGLVSEGLRVLKKIIFDQLPGEPKATPEEQCEYAVLLSRVGSVDEAISILKKLNPQNNPEIYLYHGFCLVTKWNYRDAIGEFKKSIQYLTDPYLQTVARVNLASALLVTKQYAEALDLLNSLIEKELKQTKGRLLGNCFELRTQAYFYMQLIAQAENDLSSAHQILQNSNAYDEVLIRKWQAIIESYKQKTIGPMLNFKAFAVSKCHWESVRDIDFHILKINFNQNIFDYIYFGTPYEDFRSRMIEEIQAYPSSRFFLGDPHGMTVSLTMGKFGPNNIQLSQKLQNLILALVDDFYVPISVGSLFSKIYPKEHFDIESSPLKIRQVISRLRKWFFENNIKAPIHQINGCYKIEIQQGLGLELLQNKRDLEGGASRNFARLLQVFSKSDSFTIQDVESKLGISRSDFHRTARWALQNHKLIKTGKGKSTRYQIISSEEAP